LSKLAQAGKGVYQTITANDEDIRTLSANINKPVQQEGKENKNLLLDQWEDKGPWVLLLALPLAALCFRKGLLCFALLLVLPLPKNSYALEWQDLWQNKDQQAQQAYNNKQFEQAAKLFENPDWKAAAHYKAGEYDKALENYVSKQELGNERNANKFYNQGNALAQSGQFEQAIKAYEKALALNPDDGDAKYNKELVEKELEKQKQEQKQQQQDKKQDDKQQQQDNKQDNKQQSKEDSQPKNEGDKSEKSEEQKASEQKPEQSEEKNSEQQQADEQKSPENKEQQNKQEEKKPDTEKAQQADQKKDEGKEQVKQTPANAKLSDEQQQANEQWLKRIPDDPAGLLKRKFKYQYGQRSR
jgi:Ca-activated chloride channel family protein